MEARKRYPGGEVGRVPASYEVSLQRTQELIRGGAQVIYEAAFDADGVRVVVEGKEITEPRLFAGVLHDFKQLNPKWYDRIERVLAHFEYDDSKIFSDPANINYQDSFLSFRGKLFEVNLLDLDSSEEIVDKVIQPTLKLFRSIS